MPDQGNVRGLARVAVVDPVSINKQAFTVSITNVDPITESPVNQATWEGDPGDSFVLRFEWSRANPVLNQLANLADIALFIPGGAQVGPTIWSAVVGPGAQGLVTRTMHFDSDPMNQILDTVRSGMFEIYMKVYSNGGVQPWNADTRGANTGLLSDSSHNHNEGRLRSKYILASSKVTRNTMPGTGTEPVDVWSWGDPISVRTTYNAEGIESLLSAIAIEDTGVVVRSADVATSGVNRDTTFNADSGLTAKILSDFDTDADDLKLSFESAGVFGGDFKAVFAATGHEAGWTFVNETVLRYNGRINVDPVNTLFPHAQDNEVFNAAGNDLSYTIAVQELYAWARDLFNSRSEALVGRTVTQRLKRGASVIVTDITQVTNAGGDTTNPLNWNIYLSAPGGNRVHEVEHDGRNAGVGTLDSGSQTLIFASPTSTEWAIEVADKVDPFVVFTVQAYLRVATDTGFLLEPVSVSPVIKLSRVVDPTGVVEVIAETVMAEIGMTDTFTVDLTAPIDGEYVLELRGAGLIKVMRLSVGSSGGGVHDLDSHTDVDVIGAGVGDTIRFDGSNWVDSNSMTPESHLHTHASTTGQTPDDHHLQAHNLDSHSDVNAPAPSDGEQLTWDSTSGEWVSISDPSSIHTLGSHSDVNVIGAGAGDVLRFDGADWVDTDTASPDVHTHDHGVLTGLADDDHGQYLLDSEHTKVAHDALGLSHDSLDDVSPDDHHLEVHDLDSHSDVTAPAPSDNDALVFDATLGQWVDEVDCPDCDQEGGVVGP